jgi:hypothetical protein
MSLRVQTSDDLKPPPKEMLSAAGYLSPGPRRDTWMAGLVKVPRGICSNVELPY